MAMGFLRRQPAKPDAALPCTTRTIAPVVGVWEQAAAALQAEITEEVLADACSIADAEHARLLLIESLQRCVTDVTVSCLGGARVTGRVEEVGELLLVLRESDSVLAAISMASVMRVQGLAHPLRDDAPPSADRRQSWGSWARELRESGAGEVHVTGVDGWITSGVLVFAAADFLRIQIAGSGAVDLPMRAIAVLRARSAAPSV